MSNQNKFEFLRHVHDYQNEYIRYADTKASILITWNLAIVGSIFTNDDLIPLLKTVGAALGIAAICISTVLAFLVIKPRLKAIHGAGLVYWGHIIKHETTADYTKAINDSDDDALIIGLASSNYDLAHIADKKYRRIAWSLILSGVGTATLLGVFLYQQYTAIKP